MSKTITFKARAHRPMGEAGAWTFVTLPAKVHQALGGDRARIPIEVHIEGTVFRTSAMPMDGEHHFMFNGRMRAAAGLAVGDNACTPRTWVILRDDKKRVVTVPADLKKALAAAGLATTFAAYAPSHRKAFVVSVLDAKRAETRARRIECVLKMVRDHAKPA